MKIISARETSTTYRFAVHLDPSKTIEGEPDPAWVAEYEWGKEQPKAVSMREMKLLAKLELEQRLARKDKRLPEEGADL